MKVEIAALAETDLEALYLRIRADSPTRAAEWRVGLLHAAQTFDQFPDRCPLAPESSPELTIRQLLHGEYRVLFSVTGNTVYVLHIRHGARQPLKPGPIGEDHD
jgi:plasmid stabilization system protein ParE